MKVLLKTFSKNGYDYELIQRNTHAAIFAQKSNNNVVAYETIKIKNLSERKVFDKVLEGGEDYPSTNEWGTNGWTYHFLEDAVAKMNQLTQNIIDAKRLG